MRAAGLRARRLLLILASAATAFAVAGARAESGGASGSGLRVNGYGTLGVAHVDVPPPWGYLRDVIQPTQHGAIKTGLDSRLGLQINWTVDPHWELIGQGVLRRQGRGAGLGDAIDWAFAAWRPDPGWTVRLGRTSPDIFLLSEYRDVGYAYPWVRPSVEFYGWNPVQSIDGADIQRSWRDGDADWRLRAGYGRSSTLLGSGRDPEDPQQDPAPRVRFNHIALLTASRESDGLLAKVTAVRARVSVNEPRLTPLLDGLGQLVQWGVPPVAGEAAGLLGTLTLQDLWVSYLALGVRYEGVRWMLSAELCRIGGQFRSANGERGYATAGWRQGNWMPFVIAGFTRADYDVAPVPQSWESALVPVVGAAAAQQAAALGQAAVQQTAYGRFAQRSLGLGVRWDFHSQVALKLQWEQVRVAAQGGGAWTNGGLEGTSARVLSTTLDFVF